MKNRIDFLKRITIVAILFFLPFKTFATPNIVSVTVTDVNCGNDGKLVVNATGNGTVYYALINPSEITRVSQTSNVFDNLPLGNYTVAVYDADQPNTPVTVLKTVGGKYNALNIISANSSTFLPPGISEYCVDIGRASINISGGKAPYAYELLNSVGTAIASEVTNETSVNFNELTTGDYKIRVKDCGSSITTGTIAVTSPNPFFRGLTINSVAGSLSSIKANCNILDIVLNSVTLNTNKGNLNLSSYTGLRYRAVYEDVESEWKTMLSNSGGRFGLSANNFDINKPKVFYVEVEHPCTKQVFRTEAINFSISVYPLVFMFNEGKFNPCTGVLDSVKYAFEPNTGYYCSPYTVNMTIGGKTITFSGSSPYLPTNTTYTINWVKDNMGADVTSKVYKLNSKTLAYNTTNPPYDIITQNQVVPSDCEPYNASVALIPRLYIPAGTIDPSGYPNTYEVTGRVSYDTKYTIKLTSGPSGYTSIPEKVIEIKSTSTISYYSSYQIWGSLPQGNYTAQITIENSLGVQCVINKSFTCTSKLKEIKRTTPVLVGNCGAYSIDGYVEIIKTDGEIDRNSYYNLYVYTSEGKLLDSKYAYSGTPLTYSGSRLIPGDYTLKYIIGSCSIDNYPITVPKYNPLDINLKLSGGISCPPSETANLVVVVQNGQGEMSYRIKEKSEPESAFSAWQASNIFTNKGKGKSYTVEVKDDCGTIQRNVDIQDGSQQFLTVIGPIAPGVVCKGSSVTFGAYSIGQVISYQWYKNDLPISGATSIDYTINNIEENTAGTYKVKIYTGACYLENSYTIHTISEPVPAPTIIGFNKICDTTTPITLEASSSISTSATYKWFKNGELVNTSTSKYYPTSSLGSYTVLIIPDGECASDLSAPHVLSLGTPEAPIISGIDIICQGSNTLLTANPLITEATYKWYKDGLITSGLANTLDANQGGSYTVSIGYGSCESVQSNPFILTVKQQATALNINANDETVCKGKTVTLSASAVGVTPPVEFKWYNSQTSTTVLATGATYLVGSESATYYISISNDDYCENLVDNRKPVSVSELSTITRYPDLRIQLCPASGYSVNLSSYLDIKDIVSVEWKKIHTNSPDVVINTGKINTADFNQTGVYVYEYKVKNTCVEDVAHVYIDVLGDLKMITDTVVICHQIPSASYIQLNQVFGLEGGTFIGNRYEHHASLNPYITPSNSSSDYAGGWFFDAAAAYTNLSGIDFDYTYNGRSAKKFEISYTPSGNCMGSNPIRIVFIVTDKLF